jgi:hypothetical protein
MKERAKEQSFTPQIFPESNLIPEYSTWSRGAVVWGISLCHIISMEPRASDGQYLLRVLKRTAILSVYKR